MNFEINDEVFVINKDCKGTIKDKIFSEAVGGHIYVVEFEDGTVGNFFAVDLAKIAEVRYTVEIEHAGNVMIARLIQIDTSGMRSTKNYAHGHIMHNGEQGVVQAASWAFKTLYNKVMGGSF